MGIARRPVRVKNSQIERQHRQHVSQSLTVHWSCYVNTPPVGQLDLDPPRGLRRKLFHQLHRDE